MKNIEISAFIRADLGHFSANGLHKKGNQEERLNDYDVPYWTAENPSNEYTRIAHVSPVPYNFYEPRGFFRLQDFSIIYNFPANLIQTTPIKNLRVYLSCRNLITITKWTNWDPESGGAPLPKFYTLGLNLTL